MTTSRKKKKKRNVWAKKNTQTASASHLDVQVSDVPVVEELHGFQDLPHESNHVLLGEALLAVQHMLQLTTGSPAQGRTSGQNLT